MWLFMAGGGRILCNILHNHDVKISAFCVTDKTVNKKEQLSLPVYQFDELPFKKSETLILVGVNEPWNVDVVDILQKRLGNTLMFLHMRLILVTWELIIGHY